GGRAVLCTRARYACMQWLASAYFIRCVSTRVLYSYSLTLAIGGGQGCGSSLLNVLSIQNHENHSHIFTQFPFPPKKGHNFYMIIIPRDLFFFFSLLFLLHNPD